MSRLLITASMVFVLIGGLLLWESSKTGEASFVFCDVGQGDGILITTSGGKQILVDSGVGTRINSCLSNNMPFWDRTIEVMIPTHIQKDHMEGQIDVFAKYEVSNVVTTKVLGASTIATEWNKGLQRENSNVFVPRAGQTLEVDDVLLEMLWPKQQILDGWLASEPKDLNVTSIVFKAIWQADSGRKCAYFTGDIPKETLAEIINEPCDLLKVAHHGSKTGTSDEVLDKAQPKLAVIQVGKNSYGHPTSEVLGMLSAHGVKVLRNDEMGEIRLDGDLQL